MLNRENPFHIVQISSDDTAFSLGDSSEFVQRQIGYGQLLEQMRSNSIITIIIFTKNSEAKSFRSGNVTFQPLAVKLSGLSKVHAWYVLYKSLEHIHCKQPINVITTQTVHDEAWIALLFAKQQRCPIVGQIHYDIFNPDAKGTIAHNMIGRVRYALTLKSLKYFTAIRVVGSGIAKTIQAQRLQKNVVVLPVAMSLFNQAKPVENTHREPKVIFVGRLVEQKNLPMWLEIAERVAQVIPEARFELIGDGVLRDELKSLVARKGLLDKVFFRGFVSYQDLPKIYQEASVFLITSFYEGFGRVVAEALANRLAVVAPCITGIEDIVVDGRSGYLHSPGDVIGMSTSVINLLRTPSLSKEMGQWGEKDVKHRFDSHILMRSWVQLLLDCANKC